MYTVISADSFEKDFKKLDYSVQKLIKRWIDRHLINCEDPRAYGKALSANLIGYWRYRIGDYRIIAEIRDSELIVIAVRVSHRSFVYKK